MTRFTVLTEVEPVARAEVHAELVNSLAHRFAVSQIPEFQPIKADTDTGSE